MPNPSILPPLPPRKRKPVKRPRLTPIERIKAICAENGWPWWEDNENKLIIDIDHIAREEL